MRSWSLTEEQRTATIGNAVVNMRGMCFFNGKEISEAKALEVMTGLEKEAFASSFSTADYTRKLSDLALKAVSSASAAPSAQPPAAAITTVPEDAVLGAIPTVWEQEYITPILDLEGGLLKDNSSNLAECSARFEAMLAALEDGDADASPLREAQELEDGGVRSLLGQLPKLTPQELTRIINADTKRTFQGDLAKSVLEPVLTEVADLFDGEYHQGEARVSGFLLMMAKPEQVVRFVHLLQRSPRHGVFAYWRNLAVGLAADANCVEAVLNRTDPELADHLAKKIYLPAGTWCPKYCAALGVSMLPYVNLMTFYERFVAEGADFLVRFCLSLLKEVRPALMAASDISQGLRQLEIKRHVGDNGAGLQDTIALVERVIAGTDELKNLGLDKTLTQFREEYLTSEVEKALERYVRVNNDDEEGVDECQLCNDNLPDFRCKDCGLIVCEDCHATPPAGSKHKTDHNVEEFE